MSGKGSRIKGHRFECAIVSELVKRGYSAVSSRSESKRLDDKGVDIVDDTPFFFQCKAVEKLGPTHKILAGMPNEKIPAVLHKMNNKGTVVHIRLEDFLDKILPHIPK